MTTLEVKERNGIERDYHGVSEIYHEDGKCCIVAVTEHRISLRMLDYVKDKYSGGYYVKNGEWLETSLIEKTAAEELESLRGDIRPSRRWMIDEVIELIGELKEQIAVLQGVGNVNL